MQWSGLARVRMTCGVLLSQLIHWVLARPPASVPLYAVRYQCTITNMSYTGSSALSIATIILNAMCMQHDIAVGTCASTAEMCLPTNATATAFMTATAS